MSASTGSSLTIRTGLQGNGKTLNTIKEVDAQAYAQSRPVYYHNITGLKPDKLKADWFEFDEPQLWYELPDNSIIVVDEAQGSIEAPRFGVRDPRKPVPLHISHIEIMRKRGHEMHLITQDPRFLDVNARRLCNAHIHYWRAFGSQQVVRFSMPRVKEDVEKISGFKDCEKTIVKLDKSFFDKYESAQARHHFKFKMPRAAIVLVGCVLLVGFFAYSLRDRFGFGAEAEPVTPVSVTSGVTALASQVLGGTTGETKAVTKAQYLARQVPRVADVPSSAPVYDELTKPKSYPKTYCVMTSDVALINRNASRMAVSVADGKVTGCQCYTQQNTRVATSFDYCADVVLNGRFDPSIADAGSESDKLSQGQPPPIGAPVAFNGSSAPSDLQVVVIPDSEYASRPWRNK